MNELISLTMSSSCKQLFSVSAELSEATEGSLGLNGGKISPPLCEIPSVSRGTERRCETSVCSLKNLEFAPKPTQTPRGLWIKASMEGFLKNCPSSWVLNILLSSLWCLLVWIFFSNYVPSLKAECCNSQQLKVNIEESCSIIDTMVQSEHMQKTFKRWMKRVNGLIYAGLFLTVWSLPFTAWWSAETVSGFATRKGAHLFPFLQMYLELRWEHRKNYSQKSNQWRCKNANCSLFWQVGVK